jgi:hypothetical protein
MDRTEAKKDALRGKLGLIGCIAIAILLGGGFYYDVTHLQPSPDPYTAIETQIDDIDLDQPKHDIRNELNNIKSAVEDLRPDENRDDSSEARVGDA